MPKISRDQLVVVGAALALAVACAGMIWLWPSGSRPSPEAARQTPLSPPPAPPRALAQASDYTNETLHAMLQDETDRLGIQAIGRDEPGPSQPDPARSFLGERLGQPGTRAQAEQAILQMMAMRRAIEQGSGKRSEVPITGRIAPVMDQPTSDGGAPVSTSTTPHDRDLIPRQP